MFHDRSGDSEPAGEQAQIGEEEPGGGAGGAGLEVFGEASAAAEPGEAALDHPSSGQQLEAFDAGRPLDDLDAPGAAIAVGALQLRASVNLIGEDLSELGEG